MAGLACNGRRVPIQILLVMNVSLVTVGADDPARRQADVETRSPDLVIRCSVAGLTREIEAAHVNIYTLVRIDHGGAEISLLGIIAAAGVEVAGAAVCPGRFCDALRNRDKVDVFEGHTGRLGIFFVLPGLLVANQAVDIVLVGEIEAVILPPVAGVTLGTLGPV